MKCVINGDTYTAIDNPRFSPEADLTGNSMPINEFEVRLFTNDIIPYGQYAELRDDLDNLWAKYWISYAERIGRDVDKETYIVKLIAQSSLAFLERIKLPAKFYNMSATAMLTDILRQAGQAGAITVDTAIQTEWDSITITGFCPEQTARERFQWLMLCTGGYIKSFFDSGMKVEKLSTDNMKVIPLEKTYWKPSISHRDYVTQIKVHAYTFTQGTPQSTDTYVTDGTTYWIQTEQLITLSNSFVPSGVPENVVEIEGVTIVDPTAASLIIQNLVAYYFDRMEVNAEVIDNAEYIPGDLVTVYTDEDQLVRGYIDQVGFTFGVQAKGSLHLTAAAEVDGVLLTIIYTWNNKTIAKQSMYLPKDYPYTVTTKYHDWTMMGHRYIFRPLQDTISGTLTQDTTVTVECEVALDQYRIDEGEINRQAIQSEYAAMVELLTEYYKPKINQYGSDAEKNFVSIRSMVDSVYHEKIAQVDQYTDILHIISVDQVTADEGVVDIS